MLLVWVLLVCVLGALLALLLLVLGLLPPKSGMPEDEATSLSCPDGLLGSECVDEDEDSSSSPSW